jgi:hypothetical protein
MAAEPGEKISAGRVLGYVHTNVRLLAALGVVHDPAVAPPVQHECLVQVLAAPSYPIRGMRVALFAQDCRLIAGALEVARRHS